MTDDTINAAVAAAARFIEAAKLALADRYDYELNGHRLQGRNIGKASGACRRASMDLTRALADMRRSP